MSRAPVVGAIALSTVVVAALVARRSEAQPAYALRSVNDCATCHIEPTDWANPAVKDRLCSLNCTTCHVSPAGGGLRTPSGLYYGREAVPFAGHRPSSDAAPRENPTDGGYSFLKGFSGWQPGSTPSSQVADRYGKIDPDPAFAFGADLRAMAYFPLGDGDYASALNRLAEQMNLDPADCARKFGTLELPFKGFEDGRGIPEEWAYSHALGFSRFRE